MCGCWGGTLEPLHDDLSTESVNLHSSIMDKRQNLYAWNEVFVVAFAVVHPDKTLGV